MPTSNANTNGNSDFYGFPTPTIWSGSIINMGQAWLGSWWPTSGFRNYNSATLSGVGYKGSGWSASPYPSSSPSNAYNLDFTSGYVDPVSYDGRSYGVSVRCVQE